MDRTRSPAHAMEHEHDKRRLRKGTRSCWECKRRKRRCIFAGPDSQTCASCRRHGLPCVGQEVPEAVVLARKGRSEISEQLSRVEHILQNVMDKVSSREEQETSPLTETAAGRQQQQPPTMKINVLASPAEVLLAAFPCHEDYQTLMSAGRMITALVMQFCTGKEMDHLRLEREVRASVPQSHEAVPLPDASTHPVLLARQMLYWVLFLQSPWHRRIYVFRESAWTLMERMAAAVRVVNGNDDLHGSLESLECMMLEAQYHLHLGNLRRSWVVNRRAMLLAQLMGVHRSGGGCSDGDDGDDNGDGGSSSRHTRPPQRVLDPQNNMHRPERLWAHIVFLDRFLCLLLGLPQGSSDINTVSCLPLPEDSSKRLAAVQLERALLSVAARVLERNERRQGISGRLGPEYSPAVLDAELRGAAQSCPLHFWDMPSFAGVERFSVQDMAAVVEMLMQVYYYQVLIQLHLPYMLSFIHAGASASASASVTDFTDYAAISCTRASREILRRFLAYRRFNHRTSCFRQVDFCAVPAVLTLLLAHLDVHLAARNQRLHNAAQPAPAPVLSLAHKLIAQDRAADRDLLLQVLERLDFVSQYNRDRMSAESAVLMRSLLAIEAKAAGDSDGDGAHPTVVCEQTNMVLQIKIAQYGLVYVALDGRMSKVCQKVPYDAGNTASPEPERSHWAKCIDRAPKGVFADDEAAVPPSPPASFPSTAAPQQQQQQFPSDLATGPTPDLTPGLSPSLLPSLPTMSASGPMLGDPSLGWGPAITAGTDNWATQGVDMAFFEHLFMDPLELE